MIFNSFEFLLFFPIVFLLYWFVFKGNVKRQNILLLVSSYIFYGFWDYRFLFLLVFSTSLDYFTGLQVFNAKTAVKRKFWFWLSVIIRPTGTTVTTLFAPPYSLKARPEYISADLKFLVKKTLFKFFFLFFSDNDPVLIGGKTTFFKSGFDVPWKNKPNLL